MIYKGPYLGFPVWAYVTKEDGSIVRLRYHERQAGSAFALMYIPRLRSCKLMVDFIMLTFHSILSEKLHIVRSICSASVTSLHSSYESFRHHLTFDWFPFLGLYSLPFSVDFSMGRGGLRQLFGVSLPPCRHCYPAGENCCLSYYPLTVYFPLTQILIMLYSNNVVFCSSWIYSE